VRPLRGLAAALGFGAVGFLVPVVLGLGYTVLRWWLEGSTDWDRAYDLRWLPFQLAGPAIGVALVLGCAGWATYAPSGSYRFTRTLATVFAIAVPSWLVIASVADALDESRRWHTTTVQRPVEPSTVLFLAVPPIAAAIVLTTWRSRRPEPHGDERTE
jgi:H+/Cl- antiporter ClcA